MALNALSHIFIRINKEVVSFEDMGCSHGVLCWDESLYAVLGA